MLNLILLFSITNCIGGRAEDVFGKLAFKRLGALIFRCILPGVIAGAYADSWYVWMAVTAGSALWFPFGWSFAEISGIPDDKYPKWLQSLAKKIVPDDSRVIPRAIAAKGIRGSFDILTFILLTAVNHHAMLYWLGTFAMGAIYWLCGRISQSKAVPLAELSYGAWRGLLIGMVIL